jgi:hypothetical protein
MTGYLEAKLKSAHPKVEVKRGNLFRDIVTTYITVDGDGIILLVDQIYPGNSFDKAHVQARAQFSKIGAVVLKDGKTFFRSAAQKNHFKSRHNLSLKHYSSDEINRMILLRPEESFLKDITGMVEYFQPESARLKEGLVIADFGDVSYDYSHIPSDGFKPKDRESTKIFISKFKEVDDSNGLELKKSNNSYVSYLVSKN